MNKFMVRLFAVVLSVMMLGTVAFAATAGITDDNAIAGSEFEADYATNEIKTILAYKAESANDTSYDPGDIIALEQGANVNSITINADAIVDAAFIVVLYGGDKGVTDKAVINRTGVEELGKISADAYTITFTKENGNPVTYHDVAVFKQTISASKLANKVVSTCGFQWVVNNEVKEDKLTSEALPIIDGEGDFVFGAVMYGIPEGVTVEAIPFYTLANAE